MKAFDLLHYLHIAGGGVGERAVARFVGFAAASLYSNRKEHYDQLVYESELPAPNSFCCRSFLVRKIWVIQNGPGRMDGSDAHLYREPHYNGI